MIAYGVKRRKLAFERSAAGVHKRVSNLIIFFALVPNCHKINFR